MESVRFFYMRRLWSLRIVNLFMPSLNYYDLTPFPTGESIAYSSILNSYLIVEFQSSALAHPYKSGACDPKIAENQSVKIREIRS